MAKGLISPKNRNDNDFDISENKDEDKHQDSAHSELSALAENGVQAAPRLKS
jgi:hypothetical protein